MFASLRDTRSQTKTSAREIKTPQSQLSKSKFSNE
nr:MAG TPA: hypothetical protein [Caudoviricetes sp.]